MPSGCCGAWVEHLRGAGFPVTADVLRDADEVALGTAHFCKRIGGINWDEPVLATWAERVRGELARARRPVQIIAHSFGG